MSPKGSYVDKFSNVLKLRTRINANFRDEAYLKVSLQITEFRVYMSEFDFRFIIDVNIVL